MQYMHSNRKTGAAIMTRIKQNKDITGLFFPHIILQRNTRANGKLNLFGKLNFKPAAVNCIDWNTK